MTKRGPNPFSTAWHMWRATRLPRPRPEGNGAFAHEALQPVLDALANGGVPALQPMGTELADYLRELFRVDPDTLSRDQALAYWVNFYNAQALQLVRKAYADGGGSVLDVKHAFERRPARAAAGRLSLLEIENGKIRRFGDPRIHFALVCGSASCPTLRFEPYEGPIIDSQLDDQARHFLGAGGAVADREKPALQLSRILLWYGADFVHPDRMPAWLPPRRRSVAEAILPWLSEDVANWFATERPAVVYQPYDWALACSVR